nr:hypothetical protein CFP56_15960 [Quercus suber]
MDADNSVQTGQVPMNLKEKGIDGGQNCEVGQEASQSSIPDLVRNACPTVIKVTEVQRESMKDDNNGINSAFKSGVKSHPVTDTHQEEFEFHSNSIIAPITSQAVGHTEDQDFNAKLKEIDTALAKYDNGKGTKLNPNNEPSRATNSGSLQSNTSEARDSTRVALSSTTLRVLPTWTRKKRVATGSQHLGFEHLSGRKREPIENESSSDFPSKRHQSIQHAKGDYFEVVEAVDQPRQGQ